MKQNEHMAFFHELFHPSLPRLGPGSDESTRRALELIEKDKSNCETETKNGKLRVLDIGCGNGAQTIQLAKMLDANILAVDNYQPYLDDLDRKAALAGISRMIKTGCMDMNDLDQSFGRFDLIWSEGALNLMGLADGKLNPNGFRDGIQRCHQLLAEDGYLAVSELCWFQPDAPQECQQHFDGCYPPMKSVEQNKTLIASCGLELFGSIALPESCWLEELYKPLEKRLQDARERNVEDSEKMDIINFLQKEIDIYRQYSAWYGYQFFLMRKAR